MTPRRMLPALAAAMMVTAIAACGGSGGGGFASSSGGGGSSSQSASSAGSCGTVPYRSPKDPDGALAGLPDTVKAAYNGYSEPVLKSRWSSASRT
jgi:hypothetical protein